MASQRALGGIFGADGRAWWQSRTAVPVLCSRWLALAIGLIAGVSCYAMVAKVKATFGHGDDLLDAFGVHGAGGTLGALLTGIFAR